MSPDISAPPTHAQTILRRGGRWAFVLVSVLILGSLSLQALLTVLRGVPKDYKSFEQHFKYGTIGSDNLKAGFPYWIFKALPVLFQDRLPANGKPGYEAFGLIVERDVKGDPIEDRPVGFSRRRIGQRVGIDLVGVNCSLCHAGRLRRTETEQPVPVILGMPTNTVDVEALFLFLFETARDPRFTTDTLMQVIEQQRKDELGQSYKPMGFIERTLYRRIIQLYRWEIGKVERKFCFLHQVRTAGCEKKLPAASGPGRIDTWAPYKVQRLQMWPPLFDLIPDLTPAHFDAPDLGIGEAPGFADAPPLWDLGRRLGSGVHWDRNTATLSDGSLIAAVGTGATPAAVDLPRLYRIAVWAKHAAPPRYEDYVPRPFTVNPGRANHGKNLYTATCALCHEPGGRRFGLVESIETVGTDRNRLDAFTPKLVEKLKKVGRGYEWRLRHISTTHGYTNGPLAGIWLRAPYLHNGSVPTLRDLLNNPDDRPKRFCRGNDLYDWKNIGFVSTPAEKGGPADCGDFFLYDTSLPGNSNRGHLYGTMLEKDDKEALIEFLKTL